MSAQGGEDQQRQEYRHSAPGCGMEERLSLESTGPNPRETWCVSPASPHPSPPDAASRSRSPVPRSLQRPPAHARWVGPAPTSRKRITVRPSALQEQPCSSTCRTIALRGRPLQRLEHYESIHVPHPRMVEGTRKGADDLEAEALPE